MHDTSYTQEVTQCPACGTKVTRVTTEIGTNFIPLPLSPALLVVALDNEQVARGVARLATGELRLALAGVCLEGIGGNDAFFTEEDVRDEAEAAARCDNVAAQLRKHGTRFAEAADFRDMAARHRKRCTRILSLLPEDVQRRLHKQITGTGDAPPAPVIEVIPR